MTAVHRYRTSLAWTGSTGEGYEHYSRTHAASAPPAATDLTLTADPAFKGDPHLLNPEQLLVLAASSCQLLSFLAIAAKARLDVVSYTDDADAEMPGDQRPVHLTRITLRPHIVLATASAQPPAGGEARVRRLIDLAHGECYIASSLRTQIDVDATLEWTSPDRHDTSSTAPPAQ